MCVCVFDDDLFYATGCCHLILVWSRYRTRRPMPPGATARCWRPSEACTTVGSGRCGILPACPAQPYARSSWIGHLQEGGCAITPRVLRDIPVQRRSRRRRWTIPATCWTDSLRSSIGKFIFRLFSTALEIIKVVWVEAFIHLRDRHAKIPGRVNAKHDPVQVL